MPTLICFEWAISCKILLLESSKLFSFILYAFKMERESDALHHCPLEVGQPSHPIIMTCKLSNIIHDENSRDRHRKKTKIEVISS